MPGQQASSNDREWRHRNGHHQNGDTRKQEITTITTGPSSSSHHDRTSSTYSSNQIESRTKIDGQGKVLSVAFLVDGKHMVGNSGGGKIRQWRVEDGREVATPMNAGTEVYHVAVSPDGRWVVSGTESGWVVVWNGLQGHEKVNEFKAHSDRVLVVDVAPDGKRVASGSRDNSLSVWSPASGRRLLGPLPHAHFVVAARFSPDGFLIATATWDRPSVRIYNSQNGTLLFEIPIQVNAEFSQSLAWSGDSKQLFVLSKDGDVHCIDAATAMTLLRWSIHSNKDPRCIALSSDGAVLAASGDSSVSFWDTTTHKQVGPIVHHTDVIRSMDISADGYLVVGGGRAITLQSISDILSPPSFDKRHQKSYELELSDSRMRAEMTDLEETVRLLRAQLEQANNELERLKKTVQDLRYDLSSVTSPTTPHSLSIKDDSRVIGSLAKMVQQLRHEKETLIQTLHVHEQKHQCESLNSQGRTIDAALALLEIVDMMTEQLKTNKLLMDWLAEFTSQCVSKLEVIGDDTFDAEKYDEAITAYSTILLLGPSSPNNVLVKWATMMIIRGSGVKALRAAARFKVPKAMIYRAICDVLERDGRITEAIACFRQMQGEAEADDIKDVDRDDAEPSRAQWETDFQQRCAEKLEKLGDAAIESRDYDKAAEHFMSILSLDGVDQTEMLIKWSKAQAVLDT